MSKPSLDMFLEVVLLLWTELLGASSHDLTVLRDDVCLIEVVYVVSDGSVVKLCF